MSFLQTHLEIGQRAAGILKFLISDFTILDFTISDAVPSLGKESSS